MQKVTRIFNSFNGFWRANTHKQTWLLMAFFNMNFCGIAILPGYKEESLWRIYRKKKGIIFIIVSCFSINLFLLCSFLFTILSSCFMRSHYHSSQSFSLLVFFFGMVEELVKGAWDSIFLQFLIFFILFYFNWYISRCIIYSIYYREVKLCELKINSKMSTFYLIPNLLFIAFIGSSVVENWR